MGDALILIGLGLFFGFVGFWLGQMQAFLLIALIRLSPRDWVGFALGVTLRAVAYALPLIAMILWFEISVARPMSNWTILLLFVLIGLMVFGGRQALRAGLIRRGALSDSAQKRASVWGWILALVVGCFIMVIGIAGMGSV